MTTRNLAVLVGLAAQIAVVMRTPGATAGIEIPLAEGEVDPVPATAAMVTGLNYSTSFEAVEGFIPGYIGGGTQPAGCGGVANPCWGTIDAANRSIVEGHIDSVHPFAGTQHLRISHDPSTRRYNPNFGIGVDARFPQTGDIVPRPIGPTTITMQLAIDNIDGQSFRIQPQSASQGYLTASLLFHYTGGIYSLEACDGSLGWEVFGTLLGDYYQQLQIVIDPCAPSLTYILRYPYHPNDQMRTTCLSLASNVEQLLIYGDNYPPNTSLDIDNLQIESGEPCIVYGACCDTNGPDSGCNVTSEANCQEIGEVWFSEIGCDQIGCECVPACDGRFCGEDGCGGSCGTCGDGNICNGDESCNGNGQCDPGTPLVCNDGNACNGVETCNPVTGCTPDEPLFCDDGQFCNGLETCVPSKGCVSGMLPCADTESCDEESGFCVPREIPTVSFWGFVVLTIVLLVAAKVQFGRRRPL